jgi:UDP-2-acetamido-3-amino-2,3-dideoxy-glucuronate N-acetyltransferase
VWLGRYAFVGAGSVVTKDVPDFALVYGNPARQHGWLSAHGEQLAFDQSGFARCPATGEAYELDHNTFTVYSEDYSADGHFTKN